jgi:hypothetical protein
VTSLRRAPNAYARIDAEHKTTTTPAAAASSVVRT